MASRAESQSTFRSLFPVKNHIRVLRTEKGWSQARLAEKLGVSRQSVNAVETGKFDPSLPLAFAIAHLFGKPLEEIFIHEDRPDNR